MAEGEIKSETSEKEFKLRLENTPKDVKENYFREFFGEIAERSKLKGGKPEPITISEREEMLKRAERVTRLAKDYNVDPLNMEKKFKEYGNPMRGAKDD